ncbi:ribosomal protein S12 methylthiotransferase RimO [bacterium BMS3Abin07]|nr:ribosomal protein S12 methylthiotransferase RimO [bacterium BMS3Abin07]GBE31972.1 ribosomal protein S12 methylthiotransferase RimO [bacterium BMS3Bbin05]HDL20948.1 30S ribosomal protein S12 methylthiotransferase RimO [Nitrospirota bacterium]HDO21951.1 30S ribosomal protein S12 methylthiotransferase RimO [Nitrospirota bacterium]HDZ88965.1 30S ribosomal protein S12 methylthiotransferase RimO [Nitrospirota bacterium]
MHKVAYITLGCPKNQVDTDHLIAKINDSGFGYTEEMDDADLFIVNTCCFIDDAKRESIDIILKLSQQRKKDSKLIVMGCMGERYRHDLKKEIPEIDAVFGIGDDDDILRHIRTILKPSSRPEQPGPVRCSSYAYIKIADGCNRSCSFCVIPYIRGGFRSIRPEKVINEAKNHLGNGVKELILVAQDITGYGNDIDGNYNLSSLVRDIAGLNGDFRIRLLYMYPTGITTELIDLIADEEKICNYFDMPLQHSDDDILISMKRGYSLRDFRETVAYIRKRIPDAVLRTTLIVGFPGETERQFRNLKHSLNEFSFDRLGVFKYSRQEGTLSYNNRGNIPQKIRDRRYDEIMRIQSGISLEKNMDLVGRKFRALADEIDGRGAIARMYSHAPEIDGAVLIRDSKKINESDFIEVRITDAYDYDLAGEIIVE